MPKTPAPKRRPEWKVSELNAILLKIAVSIESLEEAVARLEALCLDILEALKRPRRTD